MEPNNTPKQPVRPVNPAGAGVPPRPVASRPVAPRPTARPVAPRPAPSAPAAEPKEANEPTFDNGPSVVGKKERKTGWILAIILLLLIAAGGVGFGVWMWMDGNTQKEALNNQISSLQQTNNDLTTQLDNANNTINVDVESGEVDTADYIYVGEWGLKFKIPEELHQVVYKVDNGGEYSMVGASYVELNKSSLHLFGLLDENQSFDEKYMFDSYSSCTSASLVRVPTGQIENLELGFSFDGYDYYFEGWQYACIDSDGNEMSNQTGGIIRDALSNVKNWSAI